MNFIKEWMWEMAGDCHFQEGNYEKARECYACALRQSRLRLRVRAKQLLLSLGGFGIALRNRAFALRGSLRKARVGG
jgi:tetratricopeptide (TPR) repeat protein